MPTELYVTLTKDLNLLKSLIYKLASALALFEKEKLVHFDLKPENILLMLNNTYDKIENLKIIDFGSSFIFGTVGTLPSCTPVHLIL